MSLSGGAGLHTFFSTTLKFSKEKNYIKTLTEDCQCVLLKEITAPLTNWLYFCLPMTLCHGDRQFVFPFTEHETSCQQRAKP